MGQYITTNICYSFEVCKKDLLELKVDVKQFEKSMTEKLDLKLYQRIDGNEDNYIWNLKCSYLEDELVGFLAQQYTLMDLDKCYRGEEIIEKLENLKKAKEIIDFAEKKLYKNFQSGTTYSREKVGCFHDIEVEYKQIIFSSEGKAFLECYSEFFKYIVNLIRETSEFDIKGAVMVILD